MQEMRLIGLQEKKARDLLVLSDESWKINQCDLSLKGLFYMSSMTDKLAGSEPASSEFQYFQPTTLTGQDRNISSQTS